MKGYLTDLATRSLRPEHAVQPRLVSLFEPPHVLWRRLIPPPTEAEDSATSEFTPHLNIGPKEPSPKIPSQISGSSAALETKPQEHPGTNPADETMRELGGGRLAEGPAGMPQESARSAPKNASDSGDKTLSFEAAATGVPPRRAAAVPAKEPKVYTGTRSRVEAPFEEPNADHRTLGVGTQLTANSSPQPRSLQPDQTSDFEPPHSESRSPGRAAIHLRPSSERAPIVVEPNVTPFIESAVPVAPRESSSRVPPNIVRVHIGRVEVRAVMPPVPPPRAPERPGPLLSLDEYLKRRNGER